MVGQDIVAACAVLQGDLIEEHGALPPHRNPAAAAFLGKR
jgi:hypothetical protein